MGCKQSTPLDDERGIELAVGKSVRGNRKSAGGEPTGRTAVGSTERLMSAQMKQMQSSNNSRASKNGGIAGTISLEADEETTKELPKLNANGKLMPEEIIRRTSLSLDVSQITIGTKDKKGGKLLNVQYAYRSQRGFYPEDPMKANQDKYGITLNFGGEAGDAMFAVYDGHGSEGHDCATFAKKKLPQCFAKFLRQKRASNYMAQLRAEGKPAKGGWNPKMWPLLSDKDYRECCIKAFKETDSLMHKEDSVDDKLSGTTAAVVCFHGGRMVVCNVGDSRVLIGHRVQSVSSSVAGGGEPDEEEKCEIDAEPLSHGASSSPASAAAMEGSLLHIPLTRDQTPYRRDERERVQKLGAVIKSIDQMEGREEMHDNWGDMVLGKDVDIQGDPPRVWVKGKEYPGTAFTRSLGDRLAQGIGIIPLPEVVSADPTINDEFLVIASDGIFEFLTNETVLNICAASVSPQEACEALTKAAYDQWLTHEHRTDDITVIVLFLSSLFEPSSDEERTRSTEALVEGHHAMYGTQSIDVSNALKTSTSTTSFKTKTSSEIASGEILKSSKDEHQEEESAPPRQTELISQ